MKRKKLIAAFLIVFTVMLSSFALYAYQMLFSPNILVDQGDRMFAIEEGTTFKMLQDRLYEERVVNDLVSFSFLAKLKGLDGELKTGMYLLRSNMGNNEAINLLRSGAQAPVNLTFTATRTLQELPAKLTLGLSIDSADLAPLVLSDSVAERYGFNRHTFISMFIPNTYEVYWTVSPEDLLNRMKAEYDRFWSEERLAKADSIGLTPVQVATLASIVESETNKKSELRRVAGLYMNRFKKGIPLQADPTVVFALGDFSIRRVLTKYKEVDSPFNTYRYNGLPPGPIRMPTIAGLDAVLNYEDHRYIFMCAKPDFSGYHAFATTLSEHNRNARLLHQALNNERIFR